MKKTIKFTKMQGAGNDYIYVDTQKYPIENPQACAIQWSAPHTGIGSDGLVLIGSSGKADFSMRIFNADGSEAMMCGNASRCIGKYVYEHGLTCKQEITLDTLSGVKVLKLHVTNEEVTAVTVDMGSPLLHNKQQLATIDGSMVCGSIVANGVSYKGTYVCMGNPHFVIFVDDISTIDLPKVGPLLEHHTLFPERANIEFAQLLPTGAIRMRVWERGSGITQACGTGACATAVAAITNKLCHNSAEIIMDGGALQIAWDNDTQHVFMTGPATHVFDGSIEIDENTPTL